jgi:transcriptional repressor NrdR
MRCPFCGHQEDKVVDSRATQEESAIRRRRECLRCAKRFTTYEYVEEVSLMVIKKDGRHEPFDRKKILSGVMKACEKRPIGIERMEDVVTQVERALQKKPDREIPAAKIGEIVMEKLKNIDDVAYVRFASVYRQFKDVNEFMLELKDMLARNPPRKRPPARRRSH